MKKEDLFEAFEDIDEESVRAARTYKAPAKRQRGNRRFIALIAAAAVLVLIASVVLKQWGGLPGQTGEGAAGETEATGQTETVETGSAAEDGRTGTDDSHLVCVKAEYPEAAYSDMDAQRFVESDAHYEWWSAYRELIKSSADLSGGMDSYYTKMMAMLLCDEEENTVCSPLNTYIAFAMLAEVTGGNTRQQILDMLETPDVESLRSNVEALWESNYVDTPVLKSLLANSFWLKDGVNYNPDTLKRLAGQYYASTFSGIPGSEEMNEALRNWTDENTGGLLSEYVKEMELKEDTVLALVSTIYYKAMWNNVFLPSNTTEETFHGISGDTTVDMMHMGDMLGVYTTDTYRAVGLSLADSGTMYFYLPNEGVDVDALATDPSILAVTQYRFEEEDEHWTYPIVNLSIPKFKVKKNYDLLETLEKLGVTDALLPSVADFTPLICDMDNLFLSTANHAATVEIDENGVTGAAYTELAASEGAADPDDEIDFVLDKPFMFVVTGSDGSVLFAGAVRNIG